MNPNLRAVPSEPLPQYPLPKDLRLVGHYFVKWEFNRWLNSDLFLAATYEVQGMARALFDISQNQSPIGTLPDDDLLLSRLLRIELPRWTDARAMTYGPLHNWSRCLVGNEVRLMHPVVLEMIQDVLGRREAKALSKQDAAARKRKERLVIGLKREGVSDDVIADTVLLDRMEEWLTRNWTGGTRTDKAYKAVLIEAAHGGWFRGRGSI